VRDDVSQMCAGIKRDARSSAHTVGSGQWAVGSGKGAECLARPQAWLVAPGEAERMARGNHRGMHTFAGTLCMKSESRGPKTKKCSNSSGRLEAAASPRSQLSTPKESSFAGCSRSRGLLRGLVGKDCSA
jgi:hypothetical protein